MYHSLVKILQLSAIRAKQLFSATKHSFRIFVLVFAVAYPQVKAQGQNQEKIKLVVGIVIDQMQYEMLHKYKSRFSEDGFNKLLAQGLEFTQTRYNYIPTVTAAGHASIYTGATPSIHGIIDNQWYDRESKKLKENIEDANSVIVGSEQENPTGKSPGLLKVTTIGDMMKRSDSLSKVISISFKDRGAILPGGQMADAAYWHDWISSPGYFVSSTYYMDALPQWVVQFNLEERSDRYLNRVWETLYPIDSYTSSARDNNPWERAIGGKKAPVFPYDFPGMRARYRDQGSEYQLLWVSPYGNTLLTDFAVETIVNEDLGQDEHPDLFCVSYSVTDVAGHTFGPQSVEVEDIYLRLDLEIARLIQTLDQEVGSENYCVFLTSDHGVNQVPGHRISQGKTAGVANINLIKAAVDRGLNKRYGSNNWIEHFDGYQIYLNKETISNAGLNLEDVAQEATAMLMGLSDVQEALTAQELMNSSQLSPQAVMLKAGYMDGRSGDILLVYPPGYVTGEGGLRKVEQIKGAAHGSGYEYDTHVPLLFYGALIPQGKSNDAVTPTAITPTITQILGIEKASTVSGSVLPGIPVFN